MNVPQETSPVVSAPTTRSGGGASEVMSATCAVTSCFRKSRISLSSVAVKTSCGSGWICAAKSRYSPANPTRNSPNSPEAAKILFRMPEAPCFISNDSLASGIPLAYKTEGMSPSYPKQQHFRDRGLDEKKSDNALPGTHVR